MAADRPRGHAGTVRMVIQQWNGTPQELDRLRAAIESNCGCAQAPPAGPTCAAHALLLGQATLDHLLFVYRTRSRFIAREFQPDEPAARLQCT
jgi:hypothetical protein